MTGINDEPFKIRFDNESFEYFLPNSPISPSAEAAMCIFPVAKIGVACAKMIERLGGEVTRIVFLMELAGLKGREKLAKYDVKSVIRYDGK